MFTSAFSSGELKKLKSEIMKILIRGGGGGGGGVIGYLSCNFSFAKKNSQFFLWGGVYRIHVQLSYDFSFTMFTDEIIQFHLKFLHPRKKFGAGLNFIITHVLYLNTCITKKCLLREKGDPPSPSHPMLRAWLEHTFPWQSLSGRPLINE